MSRCIAYQWSKQMSLFFSAFFRFMDKTQKVLSFLILFALLAYIAVLVIIVMDKRVQVQPSSLLILDFNGNLVETQQTPTLSQIIQHDPRNTSTSLKDILKSINLASHDPNIEAIYIDTENMGYASLSKLQEIKQALQRFKEQDKKVIASASNYGQSDYYLATAADEIYLHPMGSILLHGFSVYQNYFKDALQKLHIDVEVFRAGSFKSYAEPFSRTEMSEEAKTANARWLKVLWKSYKQDVAKARSIDEGELQNILDHPAQYLKNYRGDLAKQALGINLVDGLADKSEVEDVIAHHIGDQYPSVSYKDYLLSFAQPSYDQPDAIGIIVASGSIQRKPSNGQHIVAKDLIAQLKEADHNDAIKAIVLRLDTPGGSALASEMIRKEVERINKHKPVLISMSSLSASGGYWIAAAAKEIWAKPTTLTGSIGVIGLIPNIHNSLKELGINTDGIGTTRIAGAGRPDMPMNLEMHRIFQMSVDNSYEKFLNIVATGRELDYDHVANIAQGRVWSGVDAYELGLVDQLGGIEEVILAAAKQNIGIDAPYDVIYIEPELDFQQRLVRQFFGSVNSLLHVEQPYSWVEQTLKHYLSADILNLLQEPQGIYSYCDVKAP